MQKCWSIELSDYRNAPVLNMRVTPFGIVKVERQQYVDLRGRDKTVNVYITNVNVRNKQQSLKS